jgi:hypothetical protein
MDLYKNNKYLISLSINVHYDSNPILALNLNT